MQLTRDDFPTVHAEWTHRDHMLIAWALCHNRMIFDRTETRMRTVAMDARNAKWLAVTLDPFGVPILTPELRQRLGDEWRKWRDAR